MAAPPQWKNELLRLASRRPRPPPIFVPSSPARADDGWVSNPTAPPGAHASWTEVQDLGTERRVGSLHGHLEVAREKAARVIHHKAVGENGRTYVKEKISSGLILVRTPDQTMAAKDSAGGRREYQALLVKGRISYAFSEFAHGRYDPKQLSSVCQLIEQMTIEERLVIRSLDFDEIWNMVWARHHVRQINWRKGINAYRCLQIVQNGWGESDGSQSAQYIRRREKFTSAWLSSDAASHQLRDMLAKAKGAGPSRWEFPKGKRSDQSESDLSCGLREFREETQISPEFVRHLPGFASRVSKYVHMNVLYVNTYYLAVLDGPAPDPATLIKLENVEQVSEVTDVQWMGLKDMDRVQGPVGRSLSKLAREAFSYVRNYRKGKIAPRHAARAMNLPQGGLSSGCAPRRAPTQKWATRPATRPPIRLRKTSAGSRDAGRENLHRLIAKLPQTAARAPTKEPSHSTPSSAAPSPAAPSSAAPSSAAPTPTAPSPAAPTPATDRPTSPGGDWCVVVRRKKKNQRRSND